MLLVRLLNLMKLCSFEVATHLGRHCRVGAFLDGRIVDLNFATAWFLAQQGESDPQRLANALAPSKMINFLGAGLRAIQASEQLFREDGPRPERWWECVPPPRGPNDETLVHEAGTVQVVAPMPNPARVGHESEIPCGEEPECRVKLAAVIGKQGADIRAVESRQYIAGFSGMIDLGARQSALGPCLVTPDELGGPYGLRVVLRINGQTCAESNTGALRPKFEQAIEALSHSDIILPGDVIAFPLEPVARVQAGDEIELEIEKIGTLRAHVTDCTRAFSTYPK
jgi:hypothetical protein